MKQDQANHAMWAAVEKIAQKSKRRDLVPACQEDVLALVLAAAPKTRRTALLEELPEKLRRDGELPGVEPERMAEAKAMLKSLRRTDTVPKKGNVTVAFGLD